MHKDFKVQGLRLVAGAFRDVLQRLHQTIVQGGGSMPVSRKQPTQPDISISMELNTRPCESCELCVDSTSDTIC
jgi:hypothetical protein